MRVLGQSLRESGTQRDLVCLVTHGTSSVAMALLRADGWRVIPVAPVANPATGPLAHFRHGFPARFWAVYTKLLIFNLTQYETVVYLDADVLVVQNIDDAFLCGRFCANLKHSDRLNSGVLVLRPAADTLAAMLTAAHALPSYTGGDQGFLNEYFAGFGSAPLFDPGKPRPPLSLPLQRLPAGYNADVGLYALNANKWMIATDAVRVMHFTLGPIKPWFWWASWLLDCVGTWQHVRERLPAHPGLPEHLGYGHSGLLQLALGLFPLVILALPNPAHKVAHLRGLLRAALACLLRAPQVPYRSSNSSPVLASVIAHMSRARWRGALLGWASISFSVALATVAVPSQIHPTWGWLLAYEWALVGFAALFARVLGGCFREGLAVAGVKPARHGMIPPVPEWLAPSAILYGAVGVAGVVALPHIAVWIGARAFIAKIIVTFSIGIALASFVTHALGEVAALWTLAGFYAGQQRGSHGMHV